jgi:hypothetical protein
MWAGIDETELANLEMIPLRDGLRSVTVAVLV